MKIKDLHIMESHRVDDMVLEENLLRKAMSMGSYVFKNAAIGAIAGSLMGLGVAYFTDGISVEEVLSKDGIPFMTFMAARGAAALAIGSLVSLVFKGTRQSIEMDAHYKRVQSKLKPMFEELDKITNVRDYLLKQMSEHGMKGTQVPTKLRNDLNKETSQMKRVGKQIDSIIEREVGGYTDVNLQLMVRAATKGSLTKLNIG